MGRYGVHVVAAVADGSTATVLVLLLLTIDHRGESKGQASLNSAVFKIGMSQTGINSLLMINLYFLQRHFLQKIL
jgi:hypothetical protein